MSLVTNNISGSANNNSKIGITGSVIFANTPSNDFPAFPGNDVVFFVSGSIGDQYKSKSVFGGDLVVSGSLTLPANVIEVTGSIEATLGFSGSLTQLVDGTSYLIAGNNITIVSESNGAVTISSTGGGGSPAGSDTHIQYNSAGSFGASSNFTYNGSTVYLTGSFSQGDGAVAYGNYSHAEGTGGVASFGAGSHAEGTSGTESRGDYSHAEGEGTATDGYASHSEGTATLAKGDYSHAEGNSTIAVGIGSHTEGEGTIASGSYQHVSGKYNLRNNDFSLFVVGNGTGNADVNRSDVLRVNSGLSGNGRVEITGSIAATVGLSGSLTKLTDGTSYLIAGNNVTITSASNGSITISSTGGSTDDFFDSSVAGSIYTSGSAAFVGVGEFGVVTSPTDKAADVFFYVSGSKGSKHTSVAGTALFGGDVTVSGSFYTDGNVLEVQGKITATEGISGSLTQLVDGTSYLIAGQNITITSQSNGSITISNTFQQVDDFFDSTVAGSIFTTGSTAFKGQESISSPQDKGDDVFFYVSGSIGSKGGTDPGVALFEGDVVISGSVYTEGNKFEMTGTLEVTNGISGSLTKLVNGTSYLIAGNYISVVSQSNGSITISGTGIAPLASQYVTIGNDSTLTNERSLTAGTGLLLTDAGANSTVTLGINDSIVATVSGTTFTGVTKHSAGLSGSLTKLTNGSSYLIAGNNISISSASNGSVTITNTFKQVDDFFDSTTAGSIFTTGSAAFIGQEALIDSPADKGTDVFFYVSGSTVAAKKDVALFGGTVVISGSMVQGNFGVSGGATAKFARAHGERTTASGPSSHAEGRFSVAQGSNSHAEGDSTVAYGAGSHAEGLDSATFIAYSHAEGRSTEARAFYSHAEGYDSITRADYSHTEGRDTQTLSTALYAHAEGYGSVAIGVASHAEGLYTLASGSNQLAVGKYNKRDNIDSLFVVGNGTGDSAANRSDIFRVNSNDVQITGSLIQKTTGRVGFMGSDTRTYPSSVGTDVFFYVSGSSGSLGKASPGVAAFGGDVMITGSLKVGTTSVTIDRNGIQFGNTVRKIVGKSNGNISILGTSELTGSFYTSDRIVARYFGGSIDVLSASPADFDTAHLTVCEPPTNPQIINLSDGRHEGQLAYFVNRTGSGQIRITPSVTLGSWTYINLAETIGASATLIWTGSSWAFLGGYLATAV